MNALGNFRGNQDICQLAIQLCANLCAKVLQYSTNKSPKNCICGQILCSIGQAGEALILSRCLQELIKGEMLMKVWIDARI